MKAEGLTEASDLQGMIPKNLNLAIDRMLEAEIAHANWLETLAKK